MRGYLKVGFSSFRYHKDLIEWACQAVLEETET